MFYVFVINVSVATNNHYCIPSKNRSIFFKIFYIFCNSFLVERLKFTFLLVHNNYDWSNARPNSKLLAIVATSSVSLLTTCMSLVQIFSIWKRITFSLSKVNLRLQKYSSSKFYLEQQSFLRNVFVRVLLPN